jgi:RNA polymerase sigma factor (TIGR02999 family)
VSARDECTRILAARDAFDGLVPIVYDELKQLAAAYLRQERRAHTLQPTALANEAYLRLVDETRVDWNSRAQFLAIAARAMRRILVEHARRRAAKKRGGDLARVTLSEGLGGSGGSGGSGTPPIDVLDLQAQLEVLAERDRRKAQVAELRLFGGLTLAECSAALGVSTTTAEDDWYMARAWLRGRLAR